ncbi:hypothetical protein ABE137_01475 [Brevibacillus laterosporus]|uniref:Uncharacterized protein n=3 Tax=Brevibacillus TaxID=55080 RepID=A0A0F7EFK6_BRELA|nr:MULTISPECIES: hypothetical protein [Brevibacillus]AKF93455.1 hypothetical protein EX87_07295 [Brevibacillus laterosporus]MCR8985840.1 hypothetical protein [Brevibacillus laterosporus]MCZ0831573.1 hypothetical protein [Brevibacillus halotolerans]GIO02580.1 hypothetical protein J5TS2_32480 [Brevibacillus halotolerans]
MRKADEMEKSHNEKSARNTFMFYTVALLIWSLYDLVKTGSAGIQFTILLIGTAIFYWTRVYLHRKVQE